MSTAVRISDSLVQNAKSRSKLMNRSIAGQIEYWAKMGKILEDNPEMSYQLVQEIMIGREESAAEDLIPYDFSNEQN